MIKRWIVTGGIFAAASLGMTVLFGVPAARVDAQNKAHGTPVAVELFTSQGCSSCPPADALLERLATNPNVVAITRPVTYWDNLGWKDTLAREGNTDLQRAYAARGGAGFGVYTPQIMVQGSYGAVGSNENAIRTFIADALTKVGPIVTTHTSANGERTITIDGNARGRFNVTVLALRSTVNVRIGRGENGGSLIRYTNVVVGEHVITGWVGGHAVVSVPAGLLHEGGADRAAVLIQQGNAGPILAARMM